MKEVFAYILAKYRVVMSCKSYCFLHIVSAYLKHMYRGRMLHFLEVSISSSEYGEILDECLELNM